MTTDVFFFSNTSWYLFNFRYGFIKRLSESGFKVMLLAGDSDYRDKLVMDGVAFEEISMSCSSINPLRELATLFSLVRVVGHYRSKKSALCCFTPKGNIYGGIIGRLLGLRVINNISGLGGFVDSKERRSWFRAMVDWLYRISLSNAEHVFFQNQEDMNVFLSRGYVSESVCERLYGSGVDLSRFTPQEVENDRSIVVFLFVGRLLAAKGVREFIRVASRFHELGLAAEFRILGFLDESNRDGISAMELDGWVNDGLVRYLGSVDDVRDEMSNADCIVLPSYYREGVPRSLIEAAALAKVIVTTDRPGCRDTVLPDFSGFLCKAHDVDDLFEKLYAVFELPEERRAQMGKAARDLAENRFDDKIGYDAYLRIIQRVVFEAVQECKPRVR